MTLIAGAVDTSTLNLDVYDDSTQATLSVIDPDGQSVSYPATKHDSGKRWTADVTYDRPGEWLLLWSTTGTGRGVAPPKIVSVAPAQPTTTGRAYATSTDWANQTGEAPPAGARQKLIEASAAVDDLLFGAIYRVDTGGLPLDQAVITALREATVAQAADTANEAAAAAAPDSFSIGKISVTRPAPATAVAAPRPGVFYSAAAWRILQRAGLTGHAAWVC